MITNALLAAARIHTPLFDQLPDNKKREILLHSAQIVHAYVKETGGANQLSENGCAGVKECCAEFHACEHEHSIIGLLAVIERDIKTILYQFEQTASLPSLSQDHEGKAMRPDRDAIGVLARELYELWTDSNAPEWDALPFSHADVYADYTVTAVRLADTYLAKMPKALLVSSKDGKVVNLWDETARISFQKELEALKKGGSVVELVYLVPVPEENK